ncbi:uncharacterized protein LOC126802419 isoform X2 [Argentina anserina]|uniref:uncharacterized protein LOC126802419 isoform X2 n=1 Tax=Argentina anserina TaxID=57926 RepID=UPI0021767225|nr:uncharacterized protein LOC126802419 isoform X2 [Potentilla anserina]
MWATVSQGHLQILRYCRAFLPRSPKSLALLFMDNRPTSTNSFAAFARNNTSDGGGGRERSSGRGGGGGRGSGRGSGGSGKDRVDALGRLLTRILRHMASELNLDMRSDGFVKVHDLLRLNLKTFANIPLSSHTVDEIKEAVRRDNKQRFSLLEENAELLIRANQGHSTTIVETERLLKPILSFEEVPVCVHGTYRKNLDSILESGLKCMTRLHVHFASGLPTDGEVISEGMKFYISDNKVILTEGFDGVVPVKYFEKIESWPGRKPIAF